MRSIVAALSVLFLLAGDAAAVEVAGVTLAPTLTAGDKTLTLNGYGIRKKFFFSVYVGALYTERRVASLEEFRKDPGEKAIRMSFVHSRVGRDKITEAFSEGFANNAPEVARTEDARRFLALFVSDFVKGDVVDILLGADGTVTVRHNGKALGSIRSEALARAVPLIYLGAKPADEGMKKGMLGGR